MISRATTLRGLWDSYSSKERLVLKVIGVVAAVLGVCFLAVWLSSLEVTTICMRGLVEVPCPDVVYGVTPIPFETGQTIYLNISNFSIMENVSNNKTRTMNDGK